MDHRSLAKACRGFRLAAQTPGYRFKNNSRADLHDENSPAIKDEDVSDVAAAVLTARGRESWKEVESGGIHGHLS
jgi:hypothetical protein